MHAECPDDCDSLLLAAGELAREAFCLALQSDAGQERHGFFLDFLTFPLLDLGRRQKDVVQNIQMREEFIALEDHTYPLSEFRQVFAVLSNPFAVQQDLSALNVFQGVQTSQKSAFAAAARPDDHDYFSLMHGQADPVQDSQIRKPLGQMVDDKERCAFF